MTKNNRRGFIKTLGAFALAVALPLKLTEFGNSPELPEPLKVVTRWQYMVPPAYDVIGEMAELRDQRVVDGAYVTTFTAKVLVSWKPDPRIWGVEQ